MSDAQKKPPESANDQPQTPPTPPAATPSEAELKTPRTRVEPTRHRQQPFFKAQTLKVLRGTIGLLEGIVEKLEAEPSRKLPPVAAPPRISVSKPVLETLPATPELSEPVLETPPATPEPSELVLDTPTATPEPSELVLDTPPATPELSEPVLDTPTATPELSEPVLDTPPATPEPMVSASTSEIPTVTPELVEQEPIEMEESQPPKPRLIDRLLPSFRSLESFWDATLATIRSVLPTTWNAKLSDWGLTSAIAGIVVVVLWTTVALLPDTPAQVEKAPPNSIKAPAELEAPKPPQPVEVESPPPPELTPEQSLIAAIQKQVAEITEQYGNGLIQSIEADFLKSRLMVKVSNSWYGLKESQQNKLADQILRRSKELDFSKLEITDLKGTLVARNPVVGSNMVILKREELATNL